MPFDRLKALQLLAECTGDDIWTVEHCQLRGAPASWIEELADCFESGFRSDAQTIYLDHRVTNQFQGVRDVDLAIKLGEFLGVDIDEAQASACTRQHLVRAIRERVEES